MNKNKLKITLLISLVLIIITIIYFINRSGISINTVDWDTWIDIYQQNKLYILFAYFIIYVLTAALSLPIALLLTLGAGVIFGLWSGFFLVSFASTIGALFAFLAARYFFQDTIEKKYPKKFNQINKKIDDDGVVYLVILRLVPLVPFFLVNLLMGITKLPAWKFYVGSQIGMIPGTFIYVNAGSTIRNISSFSELYTPKVGLSIGLILVLIITTNIVTKKMKKKNEEE